MAASLVVVYGGPALPLGFDLGLPEVRDDSRPEDDIIHVGGSDNISDTSTSAPSLATHSHDSSLRHNHNHNHTQHHSHNHNHSPRSVPDAPNMLIQAMTADPTYYHTSDEAFRVRDPPRHALRFQDPSSFPTRLHLVETSTAASPCSPTSSLNLTPLSSVHEFSGDAVGAGPPVAGVSATGIPATGLAVTGYPTTDVAANITSTTSQTFNIDYDDSDALTSPDSDISPFTDDFVLVLPNSQEVTDFPSCVDATPVGQGSSSAGSGWDSGGVLSSHLSRESSLAICDTAAIESDIARHWPSFASTAHPPGACMDQPDDRHVPRGRGSGYEQNAAANTTQASSRSSIATSRALPYDPADLAPVPVTIPVPVPYDHTMFENMPVNPGFRPLDQTSQPMFPNYPFAPMAPYTSHMMPIQHNPFTDFDFFEGSTLHNQHGQQGMPFRTADEPAFDPHTAFAQHPHIDQNVYLDAFQRAQPGPTQHQGFAQVPSSQNSTSYQSDESSPRPAETPSPPQTLKPPNISQRQLQLQRKGRAATPSHRSNSSLSASPSRRPIIPIAGSSRDRPDVDASSSHGPRRGGRQKNSRLSDHKRAKTSQMRKAGACWRCVLQRDPCPDNNAVCHRCLMRAQKGQTYFFECDRSKLPDFVFDFLPRSMTSAHQKQSIEECVNEQVRRWDEDHPIDVCFTSGYGPMLTWKLHEFVPYNEELLGQVQYLQDTSTGQSVRFLKYSPPFGLLRLEPNDITHFETYVDELLQPSHLWEFGWTCFEEETENDDFQARLLDLLCKLYMGTDDTDLRNLLEKILRMMIITYIMGHTLTITESSVSSILQSVRHSRRPTRVEQHTSPRLANRQLKFFFSIIRNNLTEQILNWQQQTFHSSGRRESTWLSTFCVMLGFAMELEEVQRTLQIQADAKVFRHEMSHDDAHAEARAACDRIDARYKLLVGLFQAKYRDRKWSNGSFGNGTPEIKDPKSRSFLTELRRLVREKTAHLQARRDVPLGAETQCRYTSRLVARFLLPFENLPP